MNMTVLLKNRNNKELPVQVRFAADGLYVVHNNESVHFNDLTRENKKIVIKHFMQQSEKAANQ